MLINYPSYQPPAEFSTPSSTHFQLQGTHAKVLEMHSQGHYATSMSSVLAKKLLE